MTAAGFIQILVPITLIEMMVAIGLSVSFSELIAVVRNWRLVTKAALANYLCVPMFTVGLLLLFQPADIMVPAGFLILAVCPGAPFAAHSIATIAQSRKAPRKMSSIAVRAWT